VRVRATLVAALVVAVALAVGGGALLVTLHAALAAAADDAARTRAHDLAALAVAHVLPKVLTVPVEDDFAQVVDASGRVAAASPGRAGPAVVTFAGEMRSIRVMDNEGEDLENYDVWAARRGPYTVYVGASREPADETAGTVGEALVRGLPALLALVTLTIWVLLGRALRPVEAIRARVEEISAGDLDRRVPEPRSGDEIGRLAQTMNAMLARLQSATARQRAFVADASHELQSPLTAFRTQLEVAVVHREDWPRAGPRLLADTQRMERLVRDLLFLASVEEAGVEKAGGLVDLDDVVLEEAARLRSVDRVQVNHVHIDTSRVSAAPVRGSREELTRLVRNLLENAVRHAATAVRAELATEDTTVRLVVSDDGPGLPAGRRERIFDRFVRLDGARSREDGGAGLGLAIVKAIAERHAGTVTAGNGSPGARFVVTLPAG
jgi:signal transduction histidine kinase